VRLILSKNILTYGPIIGGRSKGRNRIFGFQLKNRLTTFSIYDLIALILKEENVISHVCLGLAFTEKGLDNTFKLCCNLVRIVGLLIEGD